MGRSVGELPPGGLTEVAGLPPTIRLPPPSVESPPCPGGETSGWSSPLGREHRCTPGGRGCRSCPSTTSMHLEDEPRKENRNQIQKSTKCGCIPGLGLAMAPPRTKSSHRISRAWRLYCGQPISEVRVIVCFSKTKPEGNYCGILTINSFVSM